MTVQLGTNIYRGNETPILLKDQDRLRHMYMLGKTGVGKSTVFQNMCLQDILNHRGVCFIDPHGESISWILKRIPKSHMENVILFDPSDAENPFGLNLLEASEERERDFLVAQVIEIFYKIFDPEKTGVIGPQFEHWLRSAALTVMAGPEGGSLLEIPKLFIDKRFELKKRQYVKDPMVQDFWQKQMASTSDFHKSEMLNYFTSKFGHFLNNRLMRNIIGQRKSSFSFEKILDGEKVLLVDLSKGKLGDMNAQMLGLILVAKLQAAVLKRSAVPAEKRYPFYLYVDEFQNMVTDAFASMLSESRKYGLGVHLTNQYFAQLPVKMQEAVLGNVGTLMAFEIGAEDAESLSKEFYPLKKQDFVDLPKYNFFIKLLIDGKTSNPFSGVSLPPVAEGSDNVHSIKLLNSLAYGLPAPLVEEEIADFMK
ncbi:MAG: TraM recognition domain-containing protein [Candidatus Doudnabacteria bacterium]|nr:TraM recognition domain-containing protein [Candidatus Doudnabacteria bacterium]